MIVLQIPEGWQADPSVSVLDLIEKQGDVSPFGCRVGSCGTCVARILKGFELLSPPDAIEQDTLSRVAAGEADARLLCRASVERSGRIEIEKIVIV